MDTAIQKPKKLSFETIAHCCYMFKCSCFFLQKKLDLSHNELKHFACKSHEFWSKTLERLSLSHNNLNSVSSNIVKLESLQYLDLSHNNLRTLPPPRYWATRVLRKLNLSHNKVRNQNHDRYRHHFLNVGPTTSLPGPIKP